MSIDTYGLQMVKDIYFFMHYARISKTVRLLQTKTSLFGGLGRHKYH